MVSSTIMGRSSHQFGPVKVEGNDLRFQFHNLYNGAMVCQEGTSKEMCQVADEAVLTVAQSAQSHWRWVLCAGGTAFRPAVD